MCYEAGGGVEGGVWGGVLSCEVGGVVGPGFVAGVVGCYVVGLVGVWGGGGRHGRCCPGGS